MIKMEQRRKPSIPHLQGSEDTETGLPNVKMEREDDNPWISSHQSSEESKAFPSAHAGFPREMTNVKDEEELWDYQTLEENKVFPTTFSDFPDVKSGFPDVKPGFPDVKPDLVPRYKQGERPWIQEQNVSGNNEFPEHTSEFPVVKAEEEEQLASNVQDYEEGFPGIIVKVESEEEPWVPDMQAEEAATVSGAQLELPSVVVKVEADEEPWGSDLQAEEEATVSGAESGAESVQTMEFSRSQKNNKVMIYLGFEYLSFRTINGVVTWRCRQNRSIKCHSIMKTKDGNIVQEPTEHCHDSCPQKAAANAARSKMRQDMRAVSATPRNVMGNVLSGLNNDILAHMPRQSSLARSLHYHRTGNNLPNPKTINIDIPEKYRQLILHDSGVENPDRILVLGDRDLMLELNKDTIYGDGTFDKVPNIFYQLYTWHAKVGNSYPPCIYILFQKKNTDTYNRMFEIMKLLIPDLAPQKVLVDFEKACMNAVRIAFPHAEVKGCYFHLCQSLIKKINKVGLKTEYESNMNIKIKLKSLAALAFVPVSDVRSVFDKLAATFPDEDSYNEVLTYFFSTYIEGAAGRDPQFPIRTWNLHDAVLERSPATTNCWEGFHHVLNSLFYCSHPSVWSLFDGLQRDLACHKLTLANARAGRPEAKKRKYEALHDMVTTSVQQYEQAEDKLNYLRRLANLQ